MYERKTVSRLCGETISTTTAAISVSTHVMEVVVQADAGELVLSIRPPRDPRMGGLGAMGGASIGLSKDQALALAERLLAAAG